MIARWWGGGRVSAVGRALKVLPDPVIEVDVEGTRGLVLESDVDALGAVSAEHRARLLPGFDPFTNELPRRVESVLGAVDHDRVHRTAGWVTPVVVFDGRVAGTWKIENGKGGTGTVAVRPFSRWRGGARREVAAEVDRIAAFLDRRFRLEVAPAG